MVSQSMPSSTARHSHLRGLLVLAGHLLDAHGREFLLQVFQLSLQFLLGLFTEFVRFDVGLVGGGVKWRGRR